MTAYVVIIRHKTKDPAGMAKYGALAQLAPHEGLEILASKTCKFQVLEGPDAEAVVILSFPKTSDALAWYKSEEYQKALPHRLAAAETRAFLVEGVT